jgi:hypothetical protein
MFTPDYPYVPPVIPGQPPATGSAIGNGPLSGTSEALTKFITETEKTIALIPTGIGIEAPVTGQDQWSGASFADLSFIKKMTDNLNQALKKINALVKVLTQVLQIVQLFISGFNSFSKLILAAINYTQEQINKYADDAFKLGIFLNIVAPPAFFSKNPNSFENFTKARGGFNGFITRLRQSIKNTSDSMRPVFNSTSDVGGLVILLDTESLSELYEGLKQLASMFDFMQLFGLQLAPPPPNNVRGKCGFFKTPGQTAKTYGIQIQWDQNYLAPTFLISRSRTPQGSQKTVTYVPEYLMDNKQTNEKGLITVFKDLVVSIQGGTPFALPTKTEIVYEDKSFNKDGSPASVGNNFVSPTLSYIDTDITLEDNVAKLPELDAKGNATGNLVPVTTLYYVVQSSATPLIKGPFSPVLTVPIKTCNDGFNSVDVIAHPNAQFEILMPGGLAPIGQWTAIQTSAIVPWFLALMDELNKLINSVKGMITSASDSFSDFLTQIQKKVQKFIDILNAIAYIIGLLESFILGPSINFLFLPLASGGTDNFVQRIQDAQPPIVDGQPKPFSGPNGITIGMVFVCGGGLILKALEFIVSLFVKE